VLHRLIGQITLLVPSGGSPMQRRHPGGPFLLQPGAEQIPEKLVVAPPAVHIIQRHQE
jgi:hypothetical protein